MQFLNRTLLTANGLLSPSVGELNNHRLEVGGFEIAD